MKENRCAARAAGRGIDVPQRNEGTWPHGTAALLSEPVQAPADGRCGGGWSGQKRMPPAGHLRIACMIDNLSLRLSGTLHPLSHSFWVWEGNKCDAVRCGASAPFPRRAAAALIAREGALRLALWRSTAVL